jgi:hypothetical protein
MQLARENSRLYWTVCADCSDEHSRVAHSKIIFTWVGQDFIDAAEGDTLWEKAKKTVIKPGAAFTFHIVLDWLKMETKKRVGLL